METGLVVNIFHKPALAKTQGVISNELPEQPPHSFSKLYLPADLLHLAPPKIVLLLHSINPSIKPLIPPIILLLPC